MKRKMKSNWDTDAFEITKQAILNYAKDYSIIEDALYCLQVLKRDVNI